MGNNGMDDFTVEWTGYLFTGNNSGVWTFNVHADDDGGYVWLGSKAVSGYTSSNFLLRNGENVIATVSLIANAYYPIRILYGQNWDMYECSTSFTTPSGVTRYDGTGFYFSGEQYVDS